MLAYASIAAIIAGSALVRADPTPSAPGPGDVFKQGDQCTITWDADTSGVWKEMNIELMTGNNWEMVHITTVGTVDGTDPAKATLSYPCPEVTPNSAIYFYQFSSSAAPKNLLWTTRFTIAGADGSTVDPENDTEPDGQKIPWGTGALVDPSKAVAAPSYLSASTGSTSTGSSAPSGPAGATGSTSAAGTAVASPLSSAASAPSTASTFSRAPAAPTTATSGATNTTNTTSAANADNGALSYGVDNYLARAGLALGVAAFTFAVAL